VLPQRLGHNLNARTFDNRLFDYDFHAHPGMDAALKKMFALRKARHLELAALKDARSGYRNARKTRSTLGSRGFSAIERRYEPASKMRNSCESVGLAGAFCMFVGDAR